METPVLIRSYEAPPVDTRAILRYAGAKASTPALEALLAEAFAEAERGLSFSVCFCELPVSVTGDAVTVGTSRVTSHRLATALRGCERAVMFGATLGLSLDRLIARYGKTAPARALMLQAIGTERIEALCDRFCDDLATEAAARGLATRPRFSPGYGDLPLNFQREIFRVLDPKRIGLSLNQSLLMSPSKSVTALVGLFPNDQENHT